MQKCETCGNEYENLTLHKTRKHAVKEDAQPKSSSDPTTKDIMNVLTGMGEMMKDLSSRIHTIETGGVDKFKSGAKSEDVTKANEQRKNIDARVIKIVDEMLGEDFVVLMEGYADKPGFLFKIIVPERLSELKYRERPVRKKDPKHARDYEKDEHGIFLKERYKPEDKRSRAISNSDNFDAIRKYCEKVRANIVSYYQKVSKPLPEFKVRTTHE